MIKYLKIKLKKSKQQRKISFNKKIEVLEKQYSLFIDQ